MFEENIQMIKYWLLPIAWYYINVQFFSLHHTPLFLAQLVDTFSLAVHQRSSHMSLSCNIGPKAIMYTYCFIEVPQWCHSVCTGFPSKKAAHPSTPYLFFHTRVRVKLTTIYKLQRHYTNNKAKTKTVKTKSYQVIVKSKYNSEW